MLSFIGTSLVVLAAPEIAFDFFISFEIQDPLSSEQRWRDIKFLLFFIAMIQSLSVRGFN